MPDFTLLQWLVLIHGTLAIIPAVVLFKHYQRTANNDYLIFMGVFVSVPIVSFSHILAGLTNELIFYQLLFWSLSFLILMLFLHGVRTIWIRAHPIILYIGILWFCILVFLITFWELMPNQPDHATVSFWEMAFNQFDLYPNGAGISTAGGIYLLTTRFAILFYLYGIYSICIVIYAYFKIDLIHPTRRIIIARKLLIFAYVVFFMWYIIIILPLGINLPYVDILTSITLFVIAYVAIFIPEAMLISHVQILRAADLYHKISTLQSKERASFGMKSLVNYLSSIPDDLIQHLEKID